MGPSVLIFFLKLTFQHFSAPFPSTSSSKQNIQLMFFPKNIQRFSTCSSSNLSSLSLSLSSRVNLSSSFLFLHPFFLAPSWIPSRPGRSQRKIPGQKKNTQTNRKKKRGTATVLPGLCSTSRCMQGRGGCRPEEPESDSSCVCVCVCDNQN